ncbi:TRAP transporter small permease [Falsiroseomonas oryzae]|uniref:TRAP transporter small permease n=1 Tax=Falsiroseomonas oryzae TaxID=2766473 RepID=UPI0022EA2642|nr:TRAP transporter small permease [Roseomonas sp. MO-31]
MRRLDAALAQAEATLLGVLVIAMTGVTLAQVMARYAFGAPLIWSEEAARYLFVWVSMIGAALAARQGAHYALTALVERLPARAARLAGSGALAVSAAFLVVLLVTGINETRQAHLQDAATLPFRMSLPYAAIPVGAVLMLLHLLAGAMQAARRP